MGALFCLISAAGFGLMAIFAKLAYRDGVGVESLLIVRFGLAALVLLAAATVTGSLRRLPRRTLGLGFAMGACGYAVQAGLYLAAVSRTAASQVALVFSIYPVLVMVAAILIGRERRSGRRLSALAMALGGIAFVLGGASGRGSFDLVGAVLSLGSALVYTCYILVGDRVVADIPAVPLTALVCLGGFTSCLSASLLTGGPDLRITFAGWGWLALLVAVSTVGAILLFFAGLARVGPTTASLVSIAEPVVTVVAAAVVFHDSLSAAQIFGGVLVLAAVTVVQWPGRPESARTAGDGEVRDADLRPAAL